mgnify:CR=1 FL=1
MAAKKYVSFVTISPMKSHRTSHEKLSICNAENGDHSVRRYQESEVLDVEASKSVW